MAGYLFRKVEFPALVETDTVVIGVRNDNHFNRVAKKHSFDLKRHYVAVDSTGEEWWYFPERDSFTPLTLINDWSKKKIIAFYNESIQGCPSREAYVSRSLSNKKRARIVEEIVELSNARLRRQPETTL